MKRNVLLLLLLFLGSSVVVNAIPAYPVRKTVHTASGDVTVTLNGDEHLCFWLTDDGRAFRPQEDGIYAEIPPFELQRIREEAFEERSRNNMRRAQRRVGTITPRTGSYRGLVILVNFKGESFVSANPKSEFNNYFNQKGYSNYGMTGSVSDYFEAQSYGQFHLQFDVVGPYELKYEKSHYGAPTPSGASDTDPRAMIMEACKMADADVNFYDYDWNKDGRLEQVYVIYNGRGENYTHDDNYAQAEGNKNIWPHESSIGQELRLDGVYLSTYACSCELKGTEGSTLDGIGTACHEFSHCLGFPDMYDTSASGDKYGIGFWDILCAGSYNNDGCTPAGYTSYERWQAGWLTPVEVTSETRVENMKPLTESPEAYILYNERIRREYYLLENRQLSGFDAWLGGHGLLVVHVDYNEDSWATNDVNSGYPQRMTIIPADGRCSYYTEDKDPFPGPLGVTRLTDESSPAATLNNENQDGSKLMHKPIEGIRESENGLLSFYICREPLGVPQVSVSNVQETSFTASWPAVGRATSYELNLSGVPSKKEPSEAHILEEKFEKAYSKSQGFTDISGKLNQYLSTSGFSGEQLYQSPSLLRFGTSSKTGTLKSPVQSALSTGKLTIVMTLVPFTEGTKVRGTLSIVTNTQPKEEIPIELTTTQTFVLHPQLLLNEKFRVDITFASRMYIQYLAFYDGEFSTAELGLADNVVEKVKRRVDVKTYTTDQTSYTFTDLNPAYKYELTVRAVDDISASQWSELLIVPARSTGIQLPVTMPSSGQWYDLQGRPVVAPMRGGIYIRDGRKVAF